MVKVIEKKVTLSERTHGYEHRLPVKFSDTSSGASSTP
jgi:hypothetical protein